MASERKTTANRLNAKRSTGPKTEAGKTRSSRNARQHGLSRLAFEENASAGRAGRLITLGLALEQSSLHLDELVRVNQPAGPRPASAPRVTCRVVGLP